ncbi:MAG: septal junction protein FraD [Calothrix sp. MO_192.B10]|nr:septal junction protein FraD [Calothrix sp. MO_192.B10]
MDIIKDFLSGTFKFIQDILGGIQKLLWPPQSYSWQTLIYLSVFSWLMSYWAAGFFVKNIIAFCGWLFLIAGTAWYTTDNPVVIPGTSMPVGALITGGLISLFAFGGEKNLLNPVSFVLWPTMSALITAIPEFFQGTGTTVNPQIPKPEARQKIIVLILSSMLVSCWLQVYFVVDNWAKQYPSILTDNLNNSVLVKKIALPEEPTIRKIPKNGITILDKLVPIIITQIDDQPWSKVERLLKNARTKDSQIAKLGRRVIETELAAYKERDLWRVEARVESINPKSPDVYRLSLLSIWSGPSSKKEGYYFKRSCQVEPVASASNIIGREDRRKAEIECESENSFFADSPPPQG